MLTTGLTAPPAPQVIEDLLERYRTLLVRAEEEADGELCHLRGSLDVRAVEGRGCVSCAREAARGERNQQLREWRRVAKTGKR